MQQIIHNLIREHECGGMSRRQLVASLAGLVAASGAGRAGAAESASTFRGTGLNHIALDVTDVGRSRDFYVQHLGLAVTRESNNSCFLTCGQEFVVLFRNSKPGMNHYCYSIADYKVERAREKLQAAGLAPRVQGSRIYFDDPDGLEVQLAAEDHRAR